MKIAALYDIHGNVPALDAVLRELPSHGVDQIVVGGDVFPGPFASEALALLRASRVSTSFIHGNGDRAVIEQALGTPSTALPERVRAIVRWHAERLRPDELDFLRAWPSTLRVEHPIVGSILFCHATPRNDTELFTRETSDDLLAPIFSAADANLVVCGHTHMQFDRQVAGVRVMNAGSVGMPFGGTGAYWLLIGDTIELRRTEYEVSAAATRLRASDYPDVESFVEGMLQPKAEAEMLAVFKKSELR